VVKNEVCADVDVHCYRISSGCWFLMVCCLRVLRRRLFYRIFRVTRPSRIMRADRFRIVVRLRSMGRGVRGGGTLWIVGARKLRGLE